MWATVIERFQSCVCHFVSETCFFNLRRTSHCFFMWFCVCSGGIKGIWLRLSFLDPWKRKRIVVVDGNEDHPWKRKRIVAVFRVLAIVFGSGSRIWSCHCSASNQQTRDSSGSEKCWGRVSTFRTSQRHRKRTSVTNNFVLCWFYHSAHNRSEKLVRNDHMFFTPNEKAWCPVHLKIRRYRETCRFQVRVGWVKTRFPWETNLSMLFLE